MKLFKISQDVVFGYDTYDSAVVCAIDAEDAAFAHPSGDNWMFQTTQECWCKPEQVKVEYLGEAAPTMKQGVVCASYNAG